MLSAVVLAAAVSVGAPSEFFLWGPVNTVSAGYVIKWVKEASKPVLFIDSPGGELGAALQVADAIRARGGVRCVVRGAAASGAFAILQACAVRVMVRGSKIATHEPRIGVDPLDRVAMTVVLRHLEATAEAWNAICRQRLKMTAEEYRAKVFGKDWVMEWAEALKVGAVDQVVDP